MVSLRLQTLGAVRCLANGTELTELPAQRLRCAVLLYLAVERRATREAVASLLWPERTDERARHALSQKLYELRQLLGDDWLDAQSDWLQVREQVDVDVSRFEQAIAKGDIEQALELYGGEFLAGFYVPQSNFEMWADRQRARLGRVHRQARQSFINKCWTVGDRERALGHARRWVELEPLEDEAQHCLIELLARCGLRAEAIRQFEAYERSLQAEELEPLEETRALMARVRQGIAPAERTPLTGLPAAAQSTTGQRAIRPWRFQRTMVALLAFLLLVAAGWWSGARVFGRSDTPALAVLPFLNLSSDSASSQHLSEGIADELITALSGSTAVRVAARTSSFRFPRTRLGIKAIGDSLDVDLVIEGTVRREGNRLRVAAQLVKVADGYHQWSQVFDREFTDILTVQQEIASSIARALQADRPVRPTAAQLGSTVSPVALDWYLRGRYLLHRGTRTSVRAAILSFDSAIAADARYARAYANLAEAYVIAAATRELPHAEALQAATTAARHAIELAPGLADAHAALGRAQLERWNWKEAEHQAALAVELDPRNAAAHATYARVLLVRARLRSALREAELANRLEPLSPTIANTYAETLRALHRYGDAARIYRRAIELEPDLGHQNLAKLYIEMGQFDSARAEFARAFTAGAPRVRNVPLLWDAYIRARAGDREQALRMLADFQGRQPRGPNSYLIAALYLAVGQEQRAFELAELAVRERSQAAWRQLPWDPIWDGVRSRPRFRQLLREMGL